MTLLSDHRHIAKRKHAEIMAEIAGLKMQLTQRDAVLYAIIRKNGAQVLTFDDLGEFNGNCAVVARPDQEKMTLTFEAVAGIDEVLAAANEVAREGGEHFVSGEQPTPMDVTKIPNPIKEIVYGEEADKAGVPEAG